MPPTKDQRDIGLDQPMIDASHGALIELANGNIEENKDMAQQEYAKDADINYMLSKFGITPERGAPTYGEWDDTIDLQQALTSVTEARAAYAELPEALRAKFGNMEDLLAAYHNGSLVVKDGEAPVEPKTETELLRDRIQELEQRIPQQPA